jgi:hypothetical protein
VRLINLFWYGMFVDYHTRKATKFCERKSVSNYHYEAALYYYKKMSGKEFVKR